MGKTVIITGITGQDGYHLAEQLLPQGYKVYGVVRRSSRASSEDLKELLKYLNFEVWEGDITDLSNISRLCTQVRPDLFFNYAAQSHVGDSFKQPITTANITGLGALNCLEAIRLSGIHTKYYQASTSELWGGLESNPYNEDSKFYPRSPYGVAKLFAYWTTVNYRESYKMFACNGILMNHEGPRRHESFVTRKITKAVACIKHGLQDKLYLGNLEAKRDWGYAPDYVKAAFLMLTKSPEPKDYVVATGETHSIREFCELAFSKVGLDYKDYVEIDPRFFRPAEVHTLVGDSSKIREELGWAPSINFKGLVELMVEYDLREVEKQCHKIQMSE